MRPSGHVAFEQLEDIEFKELRELLIQSAGITFDEKRREVLRLHARDRAIARGCSTFAEYVALAKADDGAELQALWNQVAIHQTEFFRNKPQFEGLRAKILPEITAFARRRDRKLTIWSAGCSSGEEPYSLAIEILELLGDEAFNWDIRIIATDLATDILNVARAGRYDERHMEGVSDKLRRRYFDTDGKFYTVKSAVKDLISFAPHNLSSDAAPSPGATDLVFCCNVTIYFSPEAFHAAIKTLEGALRPGGYICLGHSESLWRQPHNLELVDLGSSFTYRKAYLPSDTAGMPILAAATSHPARPPRQGPPQLTELPPITRPTGLTPLEMPVTSGAAKVAPLTGPELFPAHDAGEPAGAPKVGLTGEGRIEHSELSEIIATAQGHLERGEVSECVELVEDALSLAPTDAALHFLLGSAQHRIGLESEALASLGKAIYCDHTFSLAYFYRAVVLEEQGEVSLAMRDYENALRWLEADHEGKWDNYLESMSHASLVDLCRVKAGTREIG